MGFTKLTMHSKSNLNRLVNGLGFMDKYGESIGFEIDGRGKYHSILGIILSLAVNSMLIGYFYK